MQSFMQPSTTHLLRELVRKYELARVELVQQQHLDALRPLAREGAAPLAARQVGQLLGQGQNCRKRERRGN